jgi:hypothetical protein
MITQSKAAMRPTRSHSDAAGLLAEEAAPKMRWVPSGAGSKRLPAVVRSAQVRILGGSLPCVSLPPRHIVNHTIYRVMQPEGSPPGLRSFRLLLRRLKL